MAITAKGTMKELTQEIHAPMDQFARSLYLEIIKTTPKRTGQASRAWTKPENIRPDDFNAVITTNRLPYIERLEEGYSKQAPDGFIQPSIDKITRRYNRK